MSASANAVEGSEPSNAELLRAEEEHEQKKEECSALKRKLLESLYDGAWQTADDMRKYVCEFERIKGVERDLLEQQCKRQRVEDKRVVKREFKKLKLSVEKNMDKHTQDIKSHTSQICSEMQARGDSDRLLDNHRWQQQAQMNDKILRDF